MCTHTLAHASSRMCVQMTQTYIETMMEQTEGCCGECCVIRRLLLMLMLEARGEATALRYPLRLVAAVWPLVTTCATPARADDAHADRNTWARHRGSTHACAVQVEAGAFLSPLLHSMRPWLHCCMALRGALRTGGGPRLPREALSPPPPPLPACK